MHILQSNLHGRPAEKGMSLSDSCPSRIGGRSGIEDY